MGRFRSLFKSDKEKAPGSPNPNPYSPQQSPTPSYDSNPYASGPQGLSSGPRSGGPSSGYGQGSPLPSPYSQDSAPPAYDARSPSNISSYSANQSKDYKYPREKFGAADGIGKDRFDGSPASQYGSFASPSQRQGGYGGLDSPGESLFANYSGPPKQATSPSFSQTGGPGSPLGPDGYPEEREMTEEERENAQVNQTKAQIEYHRAEYHAATSRAEMLANRFAEGSGNVLDMVHRQGEHIENADRNIGNIKVEAARAEKSVDEIGKSQGWFSAIGQDSRDSSRASNVKFHRRIEDEHQEQWSQANAQKQTRLQSLGATGLLGQTHKAKIPEHLLFEDDDGTQAAAELENEERLLRIANAMSQGRRNAELASVELDYQNNRLNDMLERADVAAGYVQKGQRKLDAEIRR